MAFLVNPSYNFLKKSILIFYSFFVCFLLLLVPRSHHHHSPSSSSSSSSPGFYKEVSSSKIVGRRGGYPSSSSSCWSPRNDAPFRLKMMKMREKFVAKNVVGIRRSSLVFVVMLSFAALGFPFLMMSNFMELWLLTNFKQRALISGMTMALCQAFGANDTCLTCRAMSA
ncbi:Serine/threonine-protein kinase par-1 [Bienertia sinuspersici]